MNRLFLFDREYRLRYGSVAGLDEAGRGPLAGPLVAAAVVLPDDFDHPLLNDSKKLTDGRRRELLPVIKDSALAFSTGVVTSSEIDEHRMGWAVRASFKRAIEHLADKADLFLVDGNSVPDLGYPCLFIVKGDSKSLSIAAASIIAKVTRDDMLIKAGVEYPEYGFEKHKGYGTADHVAALKKHGPTPIHRMSFEPLRSLYSPGQLTLFPMEKRKPGKAAESGVCRYLQRTGYDILERNWNCSSGEVDIIASKEGTVFFIEVKSTFSRREDLALGKMNPGKIRRVRDAALVWMAEKKYSGDASLLCMLFSPDGIEVLQVEE